MKNECSVVRDLLPLYLEGMVSEDTAAYIKEHLENCTECTTELNAMSKSSEIDCIYSNKNNCENDDTLALKTVKKQIKRKRTIAIIASIVLTLVVILTCNSLRLASIDYGKSDLYSRQDMNEAIDIIKDEFYSWNGCKLYSISYTDDSLCQRELDYCNTLADEGVTYDECIVFRMHFRSPIFGGGGWNPNFDYNWSWYLARTANGEWELLTWGAP